MTLQSRSDVSARSTKEHEYNCQESRRHDICQSGIESNGGRFSDNQIVYELVVRRGFFVWKGIVAYPLDITRVLLCQIDYRHAYSHSIVAGGLLEMS